MRLSHSNLTSTKPRFIQRILHSYEGMLAQISNTENHRKWASGKPIEIPRMATPFETACHSPQHNYQGVYTDITSTDSKFRFTITINPLAKM
jgi:hypothetical protein